MFQLHAIHRLTITILVEIILLVYIFEYTQSDHNI